MEVPLRRFARTQCRRRPCKERRRVRPLDDALLAEREIDAELRFAELLDLGVGLVLLTHEVARRHADDGEALVLVRRLRLFERLVLRGEAAEARGVDDEQDLALVLAERHRLAVDRRHVDVIRGVNPRRGNGRRGEDARHGRDAGEERRADGGEQGELLHRIVSSGDVALSNHIRASSSRSGPTAAATRP